MGAVVTVKALITALCLLAAPTLAIAQVKAPASAYGRMPEVSKASISPDGSKIALLRSYNDQVAVQVVDATTLAHITMKAPEPGLKFRNVEWTRDGENLILSASWTNNFFNNRRAVTGSFISARETDARGSMEYWRLVAAPLQGAPTPLLHRNEISKYIVRLIGWSHPRDADNGKFIHMLGLKEGAAYYQLSVQRVDLKTGAGDTLVEGAPETGNFVMNGRGEVLGRIDSWSQTNEWALLARKEGGGWRELIRERNETGSPPILPRPLPDGKFAMIDQRGTGRDALYAIDANGAVTPLLSNDRFDIRGYEYDPWTQEIVGASYTQDFHVQTFFDPALEAVRQKVASFFKNGEARIESWDEAREVFTISGFTGIEPPSYYLYRKKNDDLARIAQSYPELASAKIGNRVALTYKARDGVGIPAYLTVPEDGPPKGLPLILLPHGGPASRDDAGFDWLASFLASRGYAVMQPNFRGSSGYGVAWESAGRGQWGGVMQNDLTDAVAALTRAGMIDPKRVCIVGASYGGYAALAGASLTPDLYRCAISIGGIADMDLFIAREQERSTQTGASRDAFKLALGDLYSDAAKRRSVSPYDNAEKIQAPILLIHGALDSVVSADQSKRMRDRLVALKKPVTYVELADDDHWLSYAPTRIKTLETIETFLATHLPAQ